MFMLKNATENEKALAKSIATDAIRKGASVEAEARKATALLDPKTAERIVKLALASNLS